MMFEKNNSCIQSPFACNEHCKVVSLYENAKHKSTAGDIEQKIKSGTYSYTDVSIMEALYQFGILNHYNLSLYMNYIKNLPEGLRKPNYRSNIKRLLDDGILCSFGMSDHTNAYKTITNKTVFYQLKRSAYQYMNQSPEKEHKREYFSIKNMEIADIMRQMVQNQLEINLLKNREKTKIKLNRWGIDNLNHDREPFVCIDVPVDKEYYGKDRLTMYFIPVRKIDKGKQRFLEEIVMLNKLIHLKHKRVNVAVAIVENVGEMFEIYEIEQKLPEFEMEHLYLFEQNIKSGDCLKKLYICRTSPDNHIQYSSVPIRYRDFSKCAAE